MTASSSPRWPWLVAIGAVITIVGLALMAPYAQVLLKKHEYKGKTVTYRGPNALMFAFTKARVNKAIQGWKLPYNDKNQNGMTLVKKILWPGDFVFPLGFGLFFFSLFMVMVAGQGGVLLQWGLRLRWLPIVASVTDFAENMLHLHMLSHGQAGTLGDVPSWLPMLSSSLTTLKYGCVSVITPLVGLFFLTVYWRARPQKTWKEYSFVAFALLSFTASFGFFAHTLMNIQ